MRPLHIVKREVGAIELNRKKEKEKKNEKVGFFLGLLSRGSIVFFVFTQKEINGPFMWWICRLNIA